MIERTDAPSTKHVAGRRRRVTSSSSSSSSSSLRVSGTHAPPYRGVVFLIAGDGTECERRKRWLEQGRYLVMSARSKTEALCRMRGVGGPTVAVVDLPGDGSDLLASMRDDVELQHIPIIVVGDDASPFHGVRVRVRVLVRPVDASVLVAAVDELCA